MKIKFIFTLSLVVFVLVACTPATTIVPTETVIPHPTSTSTHVLLATPPTPTMEAVKLNVEPETLQLLEDQDVLNPDGSLRTTTKYIEDATGFFVSTESIRHIITTDMELKNVISGMDKDGVRVFWNKEKKYWMPEFSMSSDYLHPETAPYVPLDAYYDGSTHYSAAIYIAEHPDLIAENASYPYYKIDAAGSRKAIIGYEISLQGDGERAVLGEPRTQIHYQVGKPFHYLGLQQTKDRNGNIIFCVVKDNWNPVPENLKQTIPTFHGFDEAAYREYIQYERFKRFISNETNMPGELVPVFPVPPGRYTYPASEFSYSGETPSIHLHALVNQDIFYIFSADVQAKINNMLDKIGAHIDATTNPHHVLLDQFPAELSNMLLYTGLRDWR